MEYPNIVIALCYLGAGGYVVIPECPFCFASHKHKVPDIKELEDDYKNGDHVPYTSRMFTKVSDCIYYASIYSLVLKPIDFFHLPVKLKCKGITKAGEPCKRNAQPGICVCGTHYPQHRQLIEKRRKELLKT